MQSDANLMAILDARSATDRTLTVWYYVDGENQIMLAEGQRAERWYGWRVPFVQSPELAACVAYGTPVENWGIWFHRKDELTDERGIFDMRGRWSCSSSTTRGSFT